MPTKSKAKPKKVAAPPVLVRTVETIANPDLRMVAVADLVVAPENVRAGREPKVDGLAANIARYGLLSPLLAYEEEGTFYVTAGRRRLAALKLAGFTTASVIVRPKADAIADSLSENHQRAQMHPADEAASWTQMVKDGSDITAIANTFGETERYVRQRLKLGNLHPPILEALRKDEIDVGLAEAWTRVPADRQASIWKRLGKNAMAYRITQEMAQGAIYSNQGLAEYVGEAAYLAAGGKIERDLFADDGDENDLWIDRKLVEKLAADKLEAAAERLRKEGWGFVEVTEKESGYGLPKGYLYAPGKEAKSKEDKAQRGCIVAPPGYDGKHVIYRDVLKVGSAEAKRALSKARPKAADPGAPPPAEMTHKSHEVATRMASAIVAMSLIEKPEAALTAFCSHLARVRFADENATNPSWDWAHPLAIELPRPRFYSGAAAPNGEVFDPQAAPDIVKELRGREMKWRELLEIRTDGQTLEAAIDAWSVDTRLAFLAFCIAPSLQVIESQPPRASVYDDDEEEEDDDWGDDEVDADALPPLKLDAGAHRRPAVLMRRERLAALGKLAGAAPAAWWSPSADWFRGLSASVLDTVADQLGVSPKPKQKGKLAEVCATKAAELRWTPPLVAELVGTAAPKPPTPKAETTTPKKPRKKAA